MRMLTLTLLCFAAGGVLGGPSVSTVTPTFGGVQGGTAVMVVGTGFDSPSTPTCRLWGQNGLVYGEAPHYVPATVLNDTHAKCVTDAFPCAAYVDLDISMDNSTFSDSNILFNYVQFADVSPGRSLYSCGPANHSDANVSVLVKLSPLLKALSTGNLNVKHPSAAERALPGIAGGGSPSSRRFDTHDYRLGMPSTATVSILSGSHALLTTNVAIDGHPHRLNISADDLTGGACPFNTTLSVSVSCDGCPTLNSTVDMLVMPFKPNQASVDYGSHSVRVAGDPYYMYGWFMNGQATEEQFESRLSQMAMQGANTIFVYVCQSGQQASCVNLEGIEMLLDLCQTHGLRMQVALLNSVQDVLTNDTAANLDALRQIVVDVMDHPALLGWYISDDTIIDNRTVLADVYDLVRSTDPWHPVMNTISGSGNAWEYQQPRVAFDVAQYEEYDLENPSYSLPTIPTDWPMYWVAQGICGQGFTDSSTTSGAARLQAYMSVLGHGTSVMLWDWWLWTPYVSQLVIMSHYVTRGEIFAFAPAMLSSVLVHPEIVIVNTAPPVPDRGGPVVGRAFQRDDGTVFIVVANMAREPAPFTLTAPFLPATGNSTLNVLHHDYAVTLFANANNTFTSYLDGFGTRVYSWTPPTPSPPPPAAENLVKNPSFESSKSPYHADSWTELFKFMGGIGVNAFSFYMDATVGSSSPSSLRLVTQGLESDVPDWVSFPLPLTSQLHGGTEYTWSVDVRVAARKPDDVPIMVAFCFTGNSQPVYPITPGIFCQQSFNTSSAYEWVTMSCVEKMVGGAPVVNLCTAGKGVLWIDNVSVTA